MSLFRPYAGCKLVDNGLEYAALENTGLDTGLAYYRRWLITLCLLIVSGGQQASAINYVAANSLLADTHGTLNTVVLSVNSARRSSLRNAALVTSIVNALPEYTSVSIITNDRSAFNVANNPFPDRIRFIEMPDDNAITIWPQDPFLVMQDKNNSHYLLQPKSFERSGDSAIAKKISQTHNVSSGVSGNLRVVKSALYFEGGNIVSDKHHVFIGGNTIRHNAIELKLSETDVVQRFEQALGRRVLVVGSTPQPTAHIDMMITPLGNGKLAVADAKRGANIMQNLYDTHPQKVAAFENKCEENFFGSAQINSVSVLNAGKINAPNLQGKTLEMIKLSKELAPVLDEIAEAFTGFGYQVYRIPFLYGGPEVVTEEEQQSGQIAAYPMLTYNNVLIEQTKMQNKVYLPHYGVNVMDDAASSAWRKLGFQVKPIPGFEISSMYGGALRCSVKVLKREYLD